MHNHERGVARIWISVREPRNRQLIAFSVLPKLFVSQLKLRIIFLPESPAVVDPSPVLSNAIISSMPLRFELPIQFLDCLTPGWLVNRIAEDDDGVLSLFSSSFLLLE